jgi:hypothetical protein
MRLIRNSVELKLNGWPLTVAGYGSGTCDFNYVAEVLYRAEEFVVSGIAMNVGSSNSHSVNRSVDLLSIGEEIAAWFCFRGNEAKQ